MSEESHAAHEQEHLAGAIPFMKEIKAIQDVLALVDAVQKADADGNGIPDYQDLLGVGSDMLRELEHFKTELPGVTIVDVVPKTKAFLDKMQGLYNRAQKLIGDNHDKFKEQFPELVKAIQPPAAH